MNGLNRTLFSVLHTARGGVLQFVKNPDKPLTFRRHLRGGVEAVNDH